MKLGIMQPYLFPYLGYLQLINAVDKFVIYDDVQYIKRGWINRNNVLVNKKPHLFTFSVVKDEQTKAINERYYCSKTFNTEIQKFYNMLTMSYKKAIYFDEVFKLINTIFEYNELNVAKFDFNALKCICNYIGIDTEFIASSEIPQNNILKGQDKILEINKILKSSQYINPIGGTELYCNDTFEKNNIKLNFIKTLNIEYKQFNNDFIPNLSIIDILMFNSKEEIKQLLNEYELV
ncbi:WbqC family protein [Clostridium algoriphilum]|uniref:WbqC family protein n=1 Tax=Clostridium algoriphilum TaxID=198347 RepID=UPI001CF432BF|nr:WbqC family protein [Clostridium algoriphilum]MCB2295338.1 WbqC family protein [Clostridium algoriphilum]